MYASKYPRVTVYLKYFCDSYSEKPINGFRTSYILNEYIDEYKV